MYIFNFDNIKYITHDENRQVPKVSLFTHIIFKTLITLMIDLVLYCVCVWGGGGGGGANLEHEAFQYFSGADLNKK